MADLDEDQALQRWVGAGELADLRDLADGPSNEDSGGEHEEARKRPAFLAFVSCGVREAAWAARQTELIADLPVSFKGRSRFSCVSATGVRYS